MISKKTISGILAALTLYATPYTAQTKKIFHKSHSGKQSTFGKALSVQQRILDCSNFGISPEEMRKKLEYYNSGKFINPETSRLFAIKRVNDTLVQFLFAQDVQEIGTKSKLFKHSSRYKINQAYFEKGFYSHPSLLKQANSIQHLKALFDIIDDPEMPEYNVKFINFNQAVEFEK